ncbi:hypothetical protein D3C75_908440 [compost metagenome]
MLLTMLADIQSRSVEAEQLHLADKLLNVSVRYIIGIVMTQAAVNHIQIIYELLW